MNVKCVLFFTMVDWETGEIYTLSGHNKFFEPPQMPLVMNIEATIHKMLEQYLKVSERWVRPVIKDAVIHEDNVLNLIYWGTIPYEPLFLSDGHVMNITKIPNDCIWLEPLLKTIRGI